MAFSSSASAQAVGLRIDNDSFAHIDRWYSHRHELFATVAIRESWLQLRWGQAIWTPRNIQFAEPPERRPLVGTLRWGWQISGRRAWMRYTHVRQTRIFSTSPEVHPRNHRWGIFELAIRY